MVDLDLDIVYGGFECRSDVCGVSSEERDVVQFAVEGDEEGLADCNLPQLYEARDALEVCALEGCGLHAESADNALRLLELAIRREHARLDALDELEAAQQRPECCGGTTCSRCLGG